MCSAELSMKKSFITLGPGKILFTWLIFLSIVVTPIISIQESKYCYQSWYLNRSQLNRIGYLPHRGPANARMILWFQCFLHWHRECSGSVVECLTRDRWAAGWSLESLPCGPWARHIYPSLVLVQPRKTRPCLAERLLMGCKESNQTNKISTGTHTVLN